MVAVCTVGSRTEAIPRTAGAWLRDNAPHCRWLTADEVDGAGCGWQTGRRWIAQPGWPRTDNAHHRRAAARMSGPCERRPPTGSRPDEGRACMSHRGDMAPLARQCGDESAVLRAAVLRRREPQSLCAEHSQAFAEPRMSRAGSGPGPGCGTDWESTTGGWSRDCASDLNAMARHGGWGRCSQTPGSAGLGSAMSMPGRFHH